MKFSIKIKIVALGAVLSILVMTTALIFANVQYRRHGEQAAINVVDEWLTVMKGDLENEDFGEEYLNDLKDTKQYILERYEADPSEPEEELSDKDEKVFYKSRFFLLYAIEGFGMPHFSEEELKFRENYQEIVFWIADAKNAAKSNKVYAAFLTDDKTLFYIADEFSFQKGTRPGVFYPGSRTHNFNNEIKKNGDFYDCNVNGVLNRVLPVYAGDELICYIFIEYDFISVHNDANSLMKTEIIVLSIASVLMILVYALGAHFLVLRNVTKLARSATEFSDDMAQNKPLQMKEPNIKSKDEIHALANSFVALEEGIIKYINVIQEETKEKERTNAELSVATNIQLGALPNNHFDDKNTEIRAYIKSAKEVGGDFYDYFYLDENRLAVIISDVSGKGIPAALFMMKSKELLKSAVRSHSSLVNAVKEVNAMLLNNNNEMLFVTSFVGVIDFEKQIINYVNAGHEKPYIVSKDKVIKLEGESNFVMGGVEDFEYKQESAPFRKGDYLFMFTDGLNESINDKNEEFAYERIEKTLDENKNAPISCVIAAMNKNLEEFVGKKEQFDDVTMLVIKSKDDELSLEYDKKDYKIISDIVDKFNVYYSTLSEEVKSKAGIIIDELVNNLISYEKRDDLKIHVDFLHTKNDLSITIKCNGDDYNPFENHKEKYLEEFDHEIKEGGFGVSIIKDLAKSYAYEYKDNHSIVTILLEEKK